jgi:RHS repeat-associated protein
MSHTASGQTANYVWDVNRGVPQILQDGTNTYVYGLGLISSTNGSGVQTYYDSDGLGSTADLTNSLATKTDGYTYDAFGAPTHSPGSSTQPFQFTGQQTDADSGLQYLRARYYDPGTGRFLGRDPIAGFMGIPQTQNRYPYALGNPVSRTDPSGMSSIVAPRPARSDKEGGPVPWTSDCGWWGCTYNPPRQPCSNPGGCYAPYIPPIIVLNHGCTFLECIGLSGAQDFLNQVIEPVQAIVTNQCFQGLLAAGIAGFALYTGAGLVFVALSDGGLVVTSFDAAMTSATTASVAFGGGRIALIAGLSGTAVGGTLSCFDYLP